MEQLEFACICWGRSTWTIDFWKSCKKSSSVLLWCCIFLWCLTQDCGYQVADIFGLCVLRTHILVINVPMLGVHTRFLVWLPLLLHGPRSSALELTGWVIRCQCYECEGSQDYSFTALVHQHGYDVQDFLWSCSRFFLLPVRWGNRHWQNGSLGQTGAQALSFICDMTSLNLWSLGWFPALCPESVSNTALLTPSECALYDTGLNKSDLFPPINKQIRGTV